MISLLNFAAKASAALESVERSEKCCEEAWVAGITCLAVPFLLAHHFLIRSTLDRPRTASRVSSPDIASSRAYFSNVVSTQLRRSCKLPSAATAATARIRFITSSAIQPWRASNALIDSDSSCLEPGIHRLLSSVAMEISVADFVSSIQLEAEGV